MYDKELEQSEILRSAVATPIGLLTIFGSLLGVMIQSIWFEKGVVCYLFLLFGTIASYFLVATAVFLARSYHGYQYKTLPTAKELAKYKEELKNWYQQGGRGIDNTETEFQEFLSGMYITGADNNALQNLKRSEYLFKSNKQIIRCGIFVLLTFLPYSVHRYFAADAVHRVELIGSRISSNGTSVMKTEVVKLPDATVKETSQMACDPKAASSSDSGSKPTPPPPKPTPPAMQSVNLNVPPPKPTPPQMQVRNEGKVPIKK